MLVSLSTVFPPLALRPVEVNVWQYFVVGNSSLPCLVSAVMNIALVASAFVCLDHYIVGSFLVCKMSVFRGSVFYNLHKLSSACWT